MTPSLSELRDAVAAGFVTAKQSGDLTLYTYTQKCVFEGAWSPATLSARGIVLRDTGEVVARPWRKFFNLNERHGVLADDLPLNETPELAEKVDGSLIIAFHDGERWRCVTKGSWDSPQAKWAQEWIDAPESLAVRTRLRQDTTYLFELVAPWNRIVLPYATADMILLGTVNRESGDDCSYAAAAETAAHLGVTPVGFRRAPLASVNMDDPAVKDAEGFVVRYSSGLRLKMKYATYVLLHKVVTGLSVKGVWERLCAGDTDLPEGMPDELMAWYTKKKAEILAHRRDAEAAVELAWQNTPAGLSRKDKAILWARHDSSVKAALFKRLDGRPYDDILWKACRPEAAESYFGGEL